MNDEGRPDWRAQLASRRRLWLAAGLVLVALVALRWDAFASEGSAEASLRRALEQDVLVDTDSVLFFGEGGAITPRSAIFLGRVDPDGPADLYFVQARVGEDGDVISTRGLSNLTRTSSADEQAPQRLGEHHAIYATRVQDRWDALTVLDLRGEPGAVTEGWPLRARVQNAVTNLQEVGRTAGFGKIRYALRPASERFDLTIEDARARVVLDEDVVLAIDAAETEPVEGAERVEVQPLEKGMPGTITWVVDSVRNLSFVGPEPIAWLESRVFAVKDWFDRHYYATVGETDTEAEVAAETGVTEEEARRRLELAVPRPELGWPPANLTPIVDRPARGEGEWIPIVDDPTVRQYPNAPPHFYTTFLLVDPERPFTRVYAVVWDTRALQLRIMSGTREPESATGETAPGMVPRDPETLSRVVAGFNGGFQSLHGEFGMMSEGRVYLPPKPWAATVAVFDDGRVGMGSWLDPPEGRRRYTERWAVRQIPEDMVEYRQNLTSVVEGETWNPWRRWYWGAAPQGDEEQVFIDRSGLCLTREGFMVYFWGKSMGAEELGKAMLAARCVRGLHLDMNQRHTAFELYNAMPRDEMPDLGRRLRDDLEFEINVPYARGWRVRGRKLVQSMTPMTFPRYIRRDPRDFFYLTLRPTLPGPDLEARGEAGEPVAFSTEGLPHAGWPYAFARAPLGEPVEVEGEPRRTWLVRIDPRRAVAEPLATPADEPADVSPVEGHEADPLAQAGGQRAEGAEGEGQRAEGTSGVLARFTEPTSGPRALIATRELIGFRYRIDAATAAGEGRVLLRGASPSGTTQAALGVDADGFLVYVEVAPGTSAREALTLAGVDEAIDLGAARLAFALDEGFAGPDAYERPLGETPGLALRAETRAASEVMFPDVAPRPYMYWGPMQDTRVRYFRGEGPGRFQRPIPGQDGAEDEEDDESP